MWTPENRSLYNRDKLRYPSDLTRANTPALRRAFHSVSACHNVGFSATTSRLHLLRLGNPPGDHNRFINAGRCSR
jgi:hypothetical protein